MCERGAHAPEVTPVAAAVYPEGSSLIKELLIIELRRIAHEL